MSTKQYSQKKYIRVIFLVKSIDKRFLRNYTWLMSRSVNRHIFYAQSGVWPTARLIKRGLKLWTYHQLTKNWQRLSAENSVLQRRTARFLFEAKAPIGAKSSRLAKRRQKNSAQRILSTILFTRASSPLRRVCRLSRMISPMGEHPTCLLSAAAFQVLRYRESWRSGSMTFYL